MNHNHFKPMGLARASLQDIRPATFCNVKVAAFGEESNDKKQSFVH
jgi:hypothetical protein